jgi:hypothetical protein
MRDYVADGYRLESQNFTDDEKMISLRSENIFNTNRAELDEVQSSLLSKIKSDGIAICHIDDFNDAVLKEKFIRLTNYYQNFKNNDNVRRRIDNYRLGKDVGGNKQFEINSSHFLGRDLDLGDDVIEFFLSDTFLNIASAYYEKCPKSFQFNTWIHASRNDQSLNKRVSSMNWHRDPEAIKIFKIYAIIEDVGVENGPFQYVKGSHINGKYSSLQPYTFSNRYPDNRLIEKNVDRHDIVSCTGTAGTLLFVDNFGFHRGGYVQSGLRLLSQAVFLKPEVINLPIWRDQRIKLNLQNTVYDNLSTMAKYVINNEF